MKRFAVLIILLFVAFGLWAQNVDIDKLDLSKAKVTHAGPDSIYIRSIKYAGNDYAVELKYDGRRGVVIMGPYSRRQQLLPGFVNLDYVRIRALDDDTLYLSNIIVNSRLAYSGKVSWDGGVKLILDSYWKSTPPVTKEMRIADLQEEVDQLVMQVAEYEATISDGRELISRGRRMISDLQKENAEMKSTIAEGRRLIDRGRGMINDLEDENDMLTSELERTKRNLAQAQRAAEDAGAEVVYIEVEKEVVKEVPVAMEEEVVMPTRTVFSGFRGGRALAGDWRLTSSSATQNDAGAKFAKASFSVSQNSPQILYEFTVKALGSSWRGGGLHIMAANATQGDLYGYGRSYLVWVTRDPGYYKTDLAYIQLYGSESDKNMYQLASIGVRKSMARGIRVQALYNRSQGMLSIYADGDKVLDYDVPVTVRTGNSIAIRALGNVEFSGLSVKAQ